MKEKSNGHEEIMFVEVCVAPACAVSRLPSHVPPSSSCVDNAIQPVDIHSIWGSLLQYLHQLSPLESCMKPGCVVYLHQEELTIRAPKPSYAHTYTYAQYPRIGGRDIIPRRRLLNLFFLRQCFSVTSVIRR